MDGATTGVISGAVGTVVAAVFTYFLGAKRERAKAGRINAETEGKHLENVDKAIEIWEATCKELQERIKGLEFKYNNLEKKYNELLKDYANVHREFETFKRGIK